ncbi:hypothetical protein E5F05_06835 [Deinococcus metallilatus]|uniref:DUF2259 domain-containing protein n=1 Tax=Deinococcus metallilatus TaxID=1211322 RepID=A0AAJ5F4H0_9DEIO|nr:hypothetical protein [Deinococcus metallilatus]MBB5294662.1 hypothetical protein [Deinococcus metallilatus]QBY07696.1 hypothetical protein E5F05_06835 [Deinococcus metallilatus]RXJ14112.1 hypothetical protein ERJ73_05670 [Deinococcus metallilatus]TLK30077.1 hypothetical protein FCS05_05985 [Deinococcus metallilatus]GMA15876.1 hypothetical protein GCM10025871_22070 [Deinococcus metallilatus]
MKKWLVIALFFSATAQAAPAADCKSLILAGVNRVIYRTQAVFPAEPETVTAEFFDDTTPASPVAFCGYSFRPDRAAQVLTVSAPKLTAFSNIFREGYRDTGRIVLENKYYSDTSHPSNVVFDPKTYRLSFDAAGSPVTPTTLGVTVDGGPLQPLFYKNTPRSVQVPKTARMIDIYAKAQADTRLDWQRVTIDLKKPAIVFYQKMTFPTK